MIANVVVLPQDLGRHLQRLMRPMTAVDSMVSVHAVLEEQVDGHLLELSQEQTGQLCCLSRGQAGSSSSFGSTRLKSSTMESSSAAVKDWKAFLATVVHISQLVPRLQVNSSHTESLVGVGQLLAARVGGVSLPVESLPWLPSSL